MKAFVLSGGGARGAYQVGVLKFIGDLAREHQIANPAGIYSGVSAGAINAAVMASSAHDFPSGADQLVQLWSSLTSEQVFRTDIVSMGKIGLQWMGDLSFGGFANLSTDGRALLDTDPLADLLKRNLVLNQIQANIDSNQLQALAITALDYQTSESITFVQGQENTPIWDKYRKRSERTKIEVDHILASSAIPLLFPPRPVNKRHFGDGCVRNLTPLGPAVYMGATDLLVIGVRMQREVSPAPNTSLTKAPSVARVASVLLNSILLDNIESDVQRLKSINEFLRRVPEQYQSNLNFHPVRSLFISPSEDIGAIAAEMSSRLPRVIRYMLKGLGPLNEASEIISYLLFEKEFTSRLIEMGYRDGMSRKIEILKFLLESQPQSLDWEGF
jgi:NTE family protein